MTSPDSRLQIGERYDITLSFIHLSIFLNFQLNHHYHYHHCQQQQQQQ